MNQFPRLFTAMVTPFQNGSVDLERLVANIDFQLASGVKGLMFLGSTGEGSSLTFKERESILAIACKHVKGRASFMVATGASSTAQTLEYTLQAQEFGAECVLVVTPPYTYPLQSGIVEHFATLCTQTKVPICLYNHPRRSGTHLDVSTIQQLATYPKIVALKESVSDLTHVSSVIASTNLTVFCGDDPLVIPTLAFGAFGLISVASNLLPQEMIKLVEHCSLNEMREAKELFYEMYDLISALFLEGNPTGIKAAMQLMGRDSGECRLPLERLSAESMSVLKQRWQTYGAKKQLLYQSI